MKPKIQSPKTSMALNKARTFAMQTGKCPNGVGECSFKISTEKIKARHKYAPDDVFYNLRNVPYAISSPTAIYQGLEREGHEKSYCYCSKPARRFKSDTESVPVGDGFVFLVFVTEALEIFDWRFEKCCSNNPQVPENHDKRYKQLIWKQ